MTDLKPSFARWFKRTRGPRRFLRGERFKGVLVEDGDTPAGEDAGGRGLGDMTLGAWWALPRGWLYLGPSPLIPTGKSPYDSVDSSFEVTGRGFYRLDGNALIEKTFSAWDVSISLAYGWHFERDVNREFGKFVEPYERRLGDRYTGTVAVSYTVDASCGRWTGTGSLAHLKEKRGSIDRSADPTSGFQKSSWAIAAAYSTRTRIWTITTGWSHAFAGRNFPKTNVYSLGVRYAYQ